MLLLRHVVTLVMALVFFLLGYLIRNKKMVKFIAGYNPARVHDKAGLTNWVGSSFISMGMFGILATALSIVMPKVHPLLLYAPVIFILSIRTALGCKKFEER